MKKLLLATVMSLTWLSQAEAGKVEIPAEIRGELCATDSTMPPKTSEWKYLREDEECTFDGKLTITNHSMKFMETECEVTSARMIKPDKTYKFSFKCSGEGMKWESKWTFTLFRGKVIYIRTDSETKAR
jgi:hypothetical protein